MSVSIWRLVAIFFCITSAAWCQDYQQQKYGEYETHRHYRSAGAEPTTSAPASVSLKEVPVGNQTLESDVTNSTITAPKSTRDINDMFPSDVQFIDDADVVTLPDGSIALITDKPEVNTTEVPIVVPSLVGRDTSKSIVEPSVDGSMDGVNVTVEGNKTGMENLTDEAIKMLKRRQAPQFFQVPVQPQQIPLAPQFQFHPLPVQQPVVPANQFKVPTQFLLSAQPGQPAIFFQLPPADQARIAPSNIPHVVLQQQANVQQAQGLGSKQPLPKLSLNPVPIPTSTPLGNATHPVSSNGSQASVLKTREAHASRPMHNWQPPVVSFKPPPPPTTTPAHLGQSPMLSQAPLPQPPPASPSPVPARTAPIEASLPVGSPVQRPVNTQIPAQVPAPIPMMPQVPSQPMVRPQLQGQQGPSRLGQQEGQQNIAPSPSGMDVFPAQSSIQGNQALPVTTAFNQQPQQPKFQMAPMGSPIPQSPPSLQMKNPVVSPPQRLASPMNEPQPFGLRGDLLQQPPVAQRSESPVQLPQQMAPPMGAAMAQPFPIDMAQRSDSFAQRPPLQVPPVTGFPIDQSPTQSAQRLEPLTNQQPPVQIASPRASPTVQQPQFQPQINQPMGSPMNQPMGSPMNQPMGSPMNQPMGSPMNQPMGSPMNQPMGSPMNQPMGSPMNQPMGSPMNQPMGSPMNQPMGSPMNQPMGSPMNQPMGSPMNQPMGSPMNQPMGSPMNQPPQPGPTAPRVGFPGSQMIQQSPPSMEPGVPPNRVVEGAAPQVSQLNQRSVHDVRDNKEAASKERHMGKRSIGMHHMIRRQLDAVPYPSKEAYDFYVVNHYRNEYEETLPIYNFDSVDTTTVAPSYITTTANLGVQYSASRY
ncbi:MAGE-like protein 2 isoform X2 [Daphnia carinata]|uniref:MAGE-like protein 2 isoform X2 n=1 Tax=Daphnia carinata TaxID=120202 RepID=UPI00257D91A7|nr:MAGE-like protein 2 isoform X2 [Daphnia carinata]